MKYIRIALITVSALTLVCASLTLCRIIPLRQGIVVSLAFVVCEFAVQAILAYKVKNRLSMISYIIAAAVVLGIAVYSLSA